MKKKFRISSLKIFLISAVLAAAGCTRVSDEIPGGGITDSSTAETEAASAVTSEKLSDTLPDVISRQESIADVTAVSGDMTAGMQTSPDSSGDAAAVSTQSPIEPVLPDTPPVSEQTETSPAETLPTETSSMQQITRVPIPTLAPAVTETAEQTVTVSYTQESNTPGGYYPVSSYYPLNFKEQKAVWFSYLEYDRIMRGKSREEFTSALGDSFDNAFALGINTVYFQVRAYGDAYYRSSLFPTADRLDGDYDPLEIAVKEAHDRGLSIHAWVNPMRLMTDSQMGEVSENYLIGKWYSSEEARGTIIVNHAGRWYLSPAYSEAVSLICDGVREIVAGYNVDGVQIDDYFYPTEDEAFDKAAYTASGSSLSLADWRREQVTAMVKKIYSAVHSANPGAVFGISPSGNIASDRNTMYADVETWLSEAGCCDYICPQIYYGFENEAQPFETVCAAWRDLIKRDDISLVIGLAAYKSGLEDKYAGTGRYEWQESSDILARQCAAAKNHSAGVAFFRYDSLFLPEPSVSLSVTAELEALRRTGLS